MSNSWHNHPSKQTSQPTNKLGEFSWGFRRINLVSFSCLVCNSSKEYCGMSTAADSLQGWPPTCQGPCYCLSEDTSVRYLGKKCYFNRETFSRCAPCMTETGIVFSFLMMRNYRIPVIPGVFPGTLPGHMDALDLAHRWPRFQLHPRPCLWGLSLCGLWVLEIILWRSHIFLIVWLIQMTTLKERERLMSLFLHCIYSLTFVFLT